MQWVRPNNYFGVIQLLIIPQHVSILIGSSSGGYVYFRVLLTVADSVDRTSLVVKTVITLNKVIKVKIAATIDYSNIDKIILQGSLVGFEVLTTVNFYQTTWRYNPEDSHLRTRILVYISMYICIILLLLLLVDAVCCCYVYVVVQSVSCIGSCLSCCGVYPESRRSRVFWKQGAEEKIWT
jgi:hypothetical protein